MLVHEVVDLAYRECGILAETNNLTPQQSAQGLYRLNAIWKNIRAEALGEVTRDWQVPNKTRTAPRDANNINQFYPQNLDGFNQPGYGWGDGDDTDGQGSGHRQHYPPINSRILCKIDSTGHTIWFPQFPYDGARMEIVNIGMTEDVTLSANGRFIDAAGTETVTYEPDDLPAQWLYRADIATWVPIGGDLAMTDELPLPPEFDDFFVCGLTCRLAVLERTEVDPTIKRAHQDVHKKIMQRYYQPGIMSYGGQNAVPSFQSYNNYWGWGTNFRSGV